MPCREYPEKSFISFSPSANTLPAGASRGGGGCGARRRAAEKE